MNHFLPWLLIFFSGCAPWEEASDKPVASKGEATRETSRGEEILREFFDEDFAQRKIAHLIGSDLTNFDGVMQPRPRISDVIAKYGAADRVVEKNLSRFGQRENGRIYYFGRLGLVTQMGGQEVFWVLIE